MEKYQQTPQDEQFAEAVRRAVRIERFKAAILGVIIALAAFGLGVVCGLRWVP